MDLVQRILQYILDVRPVYAGRVIQLSIERVQLPNGSIAELEIVRHPGGAAIVALDDRQHVCLLRQFRHAADGWIWLPPPSSTIDRHSLCTAKARRQGRRG
jgi:ADP-ribose pyrophosphatase